jgi:hypothetical protein
MKTVFRLSSAQFAAPLFGLLLTLLFGFGDAAFAQGRQRLAVPQRELEGTPILPAGTQTLPESTVLILEMDTPLSSNRSRISDRFEARVATPIIDAGGRTLVPEGTLVQGRVTDVTPAKWGSRTGSIGITFDTMYLDGRPIPIRGYLIPADSRSRKQMDEEGNIRGGSSLKRNFLFIGGGAGAGATVATFTTAGMLAATGVGAAAGLTAGLLWKGKDAVVRPGQRFGLELNSPVNVRSPWITGQSSSVLPVRRLNNTSGQVRGPIIPDMGYRRTGQEYDPNAIRTTARSVPVYDVRTERTQDGYLRVFITSETPTAGWRIYTHHQLQNNNMLEVRLRGWPPSTYGIPQVSHPSAPTIIVQDRNQQVTRIVVHGSNGSRTVMTNGAGGNLGFIDRPISTTPAPQSTTPFRPSQRTDSASDGSAITIGPPLGTVPTPVPSRPSGVDGTFDTGAGSIPAAANRVANELEVFREYLASTLGLYRNRDGSYDALGQRRVTAGERQIVEGVGFMLDSARNLASPQISAAQRRSYAQRLRDDYQVINQRWAQTSISPDLNTRWRAIQQSVTNLINLAAR